MIFSESRAIFSSKASCLGLGCATAILDDKIEIFSMNSFDDELINFVIETYHTNVK
jgi:hypothetical protein